MTEPRSVRRRRLQWLREGRKEDLELLEAWRAGEREAGAELFRRHAASLTRFFRNKTPDAEDLIQATFLACVEGRDRFEGRSGFRTYLLGIARFTLYAWLRRASRHSRDLDLDLMSVADVTASAGHKIDRGQRHARLLEALRRLSVDQQVILELAYWESLTGPELAEVMGTTHAAIRVRLHRARTRLAELLGAADRDGLDEALRTAATDGE